MTLEVGLPPLPRLTVSDLEAEAPMETVIGLRLVRQQEVDACAQNRIRNSPWIVEVVEVALQARHRKLPKTGELCTDAGEPPQPLGRNGHALWHLKLDSNGR